MGDICAFLDLNQLTRENNAYANKTYVYTYDKNGNILTKKTYAYTTGTLGSVQNTVNYTYGNSSWKDLLTNYNGTSISYDGVGNPTNWHGTITGLTWNGRQLATLRKGTSTYSYVYNSDGIRTQKSLVTDGVYMTLTTHYVLDGTKVVAQYQTSTSSVTPSNVIYFYYDESGSPTGMKYNGNVYFFQKNLQGDIIRILNSSGTIVATYTYDAWGNIIASTDISGVSIGTKNPFRYRGYYYDTETGLYYLNSRYYDPQVGRFLNADAYVSTGQGLLGSNMFAYCENNITISSDHNGKRAVLAFNPEIGGHIYNSADSAIVNNKTAILNAAEKYDVDPCVLAACIYAEQSLNYDYIDKLTDVPLFFLDTSVGISQIKISNILTLEDKGYIEKTGSGRTKNLQIAIRLQKDTEYNIECAAAFLSYIQSVWSDEYDVSKDPAVWGTLYNIGLRTPHSSPKPNDFGKKVGNLYWYMEILLKG